MDIGNRLYFIRIVTQSEGEKSIFSAPVRILQAKDGPIFSYETYGGPTELSLRDGRLYMTRRGSSGFSCFFEQGAASEMDISLGNSSAKVPLRTHSLKILPSDDIFEAELEYDLLFDRTLTRFRLHLHIFLGGPMKIVYYGHSCFALQSGAGTSIVTDPYGDVGFHLPHITADIVTVSHGHYDHCNVDAVACKAIFDRAGDYDLSGMQLTAVKRWHDDAHGAKRGENLIFSYLIDGIRIVHLGDSGMCAEELPEGLSPDILFIPVGGHYTIDAEEAMRYIARLSPKIVIPMHYKVTGLTVDIEGVARFLDAAGKKYPVSHAGSELEISRENLPQNTKIIVMERINYAKRS